MLPNFSFPGATQKWNKNRKTIFVVGLVENFVIKLAASSRGVAQVRNQADRDIGRIGGWELTS